MLTNFLVHKRIMTKLNVYEAKTHLSEWLDRLEHGEEDVVVIRRRNEPVAELRALPRRRTTKRPIFRRDPRFALAASFFEPLPDEIAATFEDRR